MVQTGISEVSSLLLGMSPFSRAFSRLRGVACSVFSSNCSGILFHHKHHCIFNVYKRLTHDHKRKSQCKRHKCNTDADKERKAYKKNLRLRHRPRKKSHRKIDEHLHEKYRCCNLEGKREKECVQLQHGREDALVLHSSYVETAHYRLDEKVMNVKNKKETHPHK